MDGVLVVRDAAVVEEPMEDVLVEPMEDVLVG